MITITLLGIATSIVAELVTWLNKKFTGTVLQGNGAFIIALIVGVFGGLIKVFYIDGQPFPTTLNYSSLQNFFPAFAQVWTVANIYFVLIAKNLKLEVKEEKKYNI